MVDLQTCHVAPVARMRPNFVLVFMALLSLIGSGCWGCGISTHTEIGQRALHIMGIQANPATEAIRSILERHQDAFQAGHPYPDSFYNTLCFEGRFHSQSEDTHWGRFVEVAFAYIARTYPAWDTGVEKLIAFLFGIISHQVADISFHSLQGYEQGFLPVLGELNFHGSYGLAHDHGDTAGDMVGIFEWDVSAYGNEWFVPVEDLVEIYKDYYGEGSEMTSEVVEACSAMLLIGRLGEQAIGKILYPGMAKTSPAFLDDFRDYYFGGVDDMATWTELVWQQAAVALLNGTDGCTIPDNIMDMTCTLSTEDVAGRSWVQMLAVNLVHQPPDLSQYPHLPKFEDLEIRRDGRGSRISLSPKQIQEAIEVTVVAATSPTHQKQPRSIAPSSEPLLSLWAGGAYSRFGGGVTLGRLDGDALPDLVVGAPGASTAGCVYVYFGSNLLSQSGNQTAEAAASLTLCSPNRHGRFGATVAILDFNRDGVMDIAVGDPYYGVESLEYAGQVYIYAGQLQDSAYSLDLLQVLEGTGEAKAGFGSVLSVGDVDGDGADDLLAGAPMLGEQRGAVFIYTQPGNQFGHMVEGEWPYERFGSSLALQQPGGLLAVGSPAFRICSQIDCAHSEDDIQSAGRVRLFQLQPDAERTGARSLTELLSITGSMEFGSLGASLAFANMTIHGRSRELLAVGESVAASDSGNLEQTGRVVFYEINQSAEGLEAVSLARMSGATEIGRFGMVMIPGPGGSGFAVAAPYQGTVAATHGQVYLYLGEVEMPAGDVTSHCRGGSEPCPEDWAELILTTREENGLLGSAMAKDIDDENRIWLAVAAERSSQGARMSGTVHLYLLQ